MGKKGPGHGRRSLTMGKKGPSHGRRSSMMGRSRALAAADDGEEGGAEPPDMGKRVLEDLTLPSSLTHAHPLTVTTGKRVLARR